MFFRDSTMPSWQVLTRLLVVAALGLIGPLSWAQDAPPEPAPEVSAEEARSLIKTLEDPEARARLVRQLEILAQVQEEQAPEPEVRSATAQVLQALSDRIGGLGQYAVELSSDVQELPEVVDWVEAQAQDPQARKLWSEVLINLALVLGAGYAAFYLLRLSLLRARRRVAARTTRSWVVGALWLLLMLLLSLVPIAAFAAAAYLTLGFVEPAEKTRLVALAWVNASIIVRVMLALARFVLAAEAPGLRPLPIGDESAHYGEIWARRLSFTAVYGYLALEAAFLLGMPVTAYETLLRLLGLLVTVLVVVLISQNRQPIARLLRGRVPPAGGASLLGGLRRSLARIWLPLAILYVLVLYGIWALGLGNGFAFVFEATALSLLALMVGAILVRLLAQLFTRGLRVSAELRARFPGLEPRVNRYLPALHAILRWAVYGLTAMLVLQAWGADAIRWLASEPSQVLGSTLVSVILIVSASVVIWEVASTLIERYLADEEVNGKPRVRSNRAKTLLTVGRNALMIVLFVVASLLVLSELGMNIGPLLAGAGVVGLAVGFGSQRLVQDIITGVFILFQDLMGVGDVVKVGDKAGLVEAISIRNVRLRDLAGTVHTIPFSSIDTISNLTKDFAYYVFDIGVAYRESVDEVMEVLRAIGAELQQDPEFGWLILEPLEVLGVDAFADSAVIIKARIKTRPIKQWAVGREFHRRMKNRFDELGIEIPFPHRAIYFGVDKSGQAPPAHFQLGSAGDAQTTTFDRLAGQGPKTQT
jgi:small-conductance mechanosensitive channel